MKNPKIKTKVIHSQTKAAWNVVSTQLGGKYKIARVPYLVLFDQKLSNRERQEAFEHATFISFCFNNSDFICDSVSNIKVKTPIVSHIKTPTPEERLLELERLFQFY